MGANEQRPGTSVALIHLGCEKNLVDSERILGSLAAHGHAICQDADAAQVLVVNTCGFIGSAKQESIDAILAACERKESGTARAVIVAGCLAQRYAADLAAEMAEVDAFVGLGDLARIREVCDAVAAEAAVPDAPLPAGMSLYPVGIEGGRLRLTPPHYAFLRIAEGCDHPCAFCAIPLMRGKNRSKSFEDLVAEARELVADGARELVLIAQDTGSYGLDRYRRQSLAELMRRLDAEVDGLWGQRLMYLHPVMARPELVHVFGAVATALPYVDMPIQHGSDALLKTMRRGTTTALIRDLAEALRARDPRMTLRTTVLLGFPGETEADVDALCELISEVGFDRLGTFTYSREEQTPAYDLADQVPEAVALARAERVMALQQQVAHARNARRVGEVTTAFVDALEADGLDADGPDADAPDAVATARTYGEAPEVDGCVLLPARGRVVGEELTIRITAAKGYDLIAEVVDPVAVPTTA